MTQPAVGDLAPTFTLLNQDENPVNPLDSLSRFVVIYFYPKALTSGCTVQACAIRDNWNDLINRGITIYGVSPDSPKLLRKFKDSENLPFDLLSDPEHTAAEFYGTWQEKSMYGRKYMGMARQTFIVGPDKTIIITMHKVNTSTHVSDLIKAIDLYLSENK
ncbi:MAG: thioredoxin-dependent thiol peroxidase [Pseudomonas fluorescens]|nr:MAG: thioredoxin-dependent thiol peroxidase [Pseudomonas fluorescens]